MAKTPQNVMRLPSVGLLITERLVLCALVQKSKPFAKLSHPSHGCAIQTSSHTAHWIKTINVNM
jgi:hypothetical protein